MSQAFANKTAPSPSEWFADRWAKLVDFGPIRQQELLETIQYAFLYLVVSLPIGSILDVYFWEVDPNKSTMRIFWEVVTQIMVNVVVLYYIRKIVKLVPFLFQYSDRTFIPGFSEGIGGGILVSLSFVSIQKNLLAKLKLLSGRFQDMLKKQVPVPK